MTTRQDRANALLWEYIEDYINDLKWMAKDEHYTKKERKLLVRIADELLRLQGKAEYRVDEEWMAI